MEHKQGEFYLGHRIGAAGQREDTPLTYDATDLTTHGVIVGMTGSGKTGLGIIAIEEALLSGIPVLVLDPKGDMTNLKLTFPDLQPGDFRPWINEGDATRAGQSPDEFAAAQAELWKNGLARSGLGTDDLRALQAAGRVTIFTPGSEAGVPLNIIGNLAPPSSGANAESLREESAALVSGLLSLVGIEADPLSSREHVLLANLVERAWVAGKTLDLAGLIGQTLDPPVRKLGVFEVDTFFPPDDRRALALRLNALVASASFDAWTRGQPLDIEALLHEADGRPRISVIYLAHLSDAERQFVVALVLAKLVTWMRGQSGTTDLRCLVYMDEMFGFAPPSAEPPSKRVILTLLKQARAYGVGCCCRRRTRWTSTTRRCPTRGPGWSAVFRPSATRNASSRGCAQPAAPPTSQPSTERSAGSRLASFCCTTRTTAAAPRCSQRAGRCPTCADP